MSQSLNTLFADLEEVASYDGPWRPLREQAPLLRERLKELRERETRLDDVLVVALVGGSGVGKSTLLNALAGDELAETSEYRPCTPVPTVYQPPGAEFAVEGARTVSGSALENLVLIDTPDSDTIVREHRAMVEQVLERCDLVVMCGSPDKYLDEATWSLLRPIRDERTLVCVETKASPSTNPVEAHWRERLAEQGFKPERYFRVNALRALDRKLTGGDPGEEEYGFGSFETFLEQELTSDRVRHIKRSNIQGLLNKTLDTLHDRAGVKRPALEALHESLSQAQADTLEDVLDRIRERLFAEPHLWTFALGREMSTRAKGLVCTLFRVLEAVRTLPGWLARRMPRRLGPMPGQQAAALLTDKDVFGNDIDVAGDDIRNLYEHHHAQLATALVRAEFDAPDAQPGFERFAGALRERLSALLRGPARDGVVKRARRLTSWPVVLLLDALPAAFIGYAGYRIVADYFTGKTLPPNYFTHTGAVLAILLALLVLVLSLLMRASAWGARKRAAAGLRNALSGETLVFAPEEEDLTRAIGLVERIESARSRNRG